MTSRFQICDQMHVQDSRIEGRRSCRCSRFRWLGDGTRVLALSGVSSTDSLKRHLSVKSPLGLSRRPQGPGTITGAGKETADESPLASPIHLKVAASPSMVGGVIRPMTSPTVTLAVTPLISACRQRRPVPDRKRFVATSLDSATGDLLHDGLDRRGSIMVEPEWSGRPCARSFLDPITSCRL
jgi:hypothetical protein